MSEKSISYISIFTEAQQSNNQRLHKKRQIRSDLKQIFLTCSLSAANVLISKGPNSAVPDENKAEMTLK